LEWIRKVITSEDHGSKHASAQSLLRHYESGGHGPDPEQVWWLLDGKIMENEPALEELPAGSLWFEQGPPCFTLADRAAMYVCTSDSSHRRGFATTDVGIRVISSAPPTASTQCTMSQAGKEITISMKSKGFANSSSVPNKVNSKTGKKEGKDHQPAGLVELH